MTIAEDTTNSPARAVSSGATTTTAAFTPPNAGCILVAFMFGDANNGSADESLTASDSLSGTWSTPILDNARGGAAVAVSWRAVAAGTAASMTCTVTDNKGSVAKEIYVRIFTGTDLAAPFGATGTAGTVAISLVTTAANSWCWSGFLGSNAAQTAGTATVQKDQFGGFDSGDANAVYASTNTTATAGTTITLTNVGGTAAHHVAVELVPPSGSTPIALADTGSAVDTLTVAAASPLADSGSAAQALTATATAPLADAGSATQTLTATATVPLADAGAAADTALAGIAINPGDTGAGTDTMGVTATAPLADSGTGTQTLAVTATSPITDGGTAADSMTVVVTLALADTGHAVDTLAVAAAVGLADAGAGADAAAGSSSGGGNNKTLADGGSASECLCVCKELLRPSTGTITRPSTGTVDRCSCSC